MKYLITFLVLLGSSIIMSADNLPSFPGGEDALAKYVKDNTRYPSVAKENDVEGIVTVGFIVMTDGSLQNIKIEKFVDPELEKEAIRVVSGMPAWIPAQNSGSPVEAPAKVDVPFLLE